MARGLQLLQVTCKTFRQSRLATSTRPAAAGMSWHPVRQAGGQADHLLMGSRTGTFHHMDLWWT